MVSLECSADADVLWHACLCHGISVGNVADVDATVGVIADSL